VGDISGAQLGASLTVYAVTYTGMLIAYMIVLTHMAGKGASAAEKEVAQAGAALVPGAAK
jgi:hypothetical protein